MEKTPLETICQLLRITPQAQLLLEGDSILAASPEAQRLFPGILSGFTADQIFGADIQQYHNFQQEGSLIFTTQLSGRSCDIAVTAIAPYCLCTITPVTPFEHSETLQTLSQQLRTPLSSMMAVAPKVLPLLEQVEDRTALTQAAALNQGLHQLLRTTENLEQYAAPQQTLQMTRFDLHAYFQSMEDQLHSLSKTAAWEIELHYPAEPCPCTADQSMLTRAITNLLSNAIKFSAADQPIILTCRKQQGRILISVRDHGPGIPPDQMGTIFQRSQHRGQIPDPRWGAGLGLQSARRIVEAHGGRLMLESVENVGTTVYLSLDAQPSQKSNMLCDAATMMVASNGINPILVGLSDVLPTQVFDILDTCL